MLRDIAAITALCFAFQLGAQDTLYFDKAYEATRHRDSACFFEIRLFDPADTNRCTVLSYYASGKVISAVKYSNFRKNECNGRSSFWNKKQQLSHEIPYKEGKKQGVQKVFYENGQLKSAITWDQDTLVRTAFFNEDGTPKTEVYEDDPLFEGDQQAPLFPGGLGALGMYLRTLLRYPEQAREHNIQGTVLVSFVVEKNGELTNIALEKSVAPVLDQEALRVVNRMPRWEPGRIDEAPVRAKYVLPITFRLE